MYAHVGYEYVIFMYYIYRSSSPNPAVYQAVKIDDVGYNSIMKVSIR